MEGRTRVMRQQPHHWHLWPGHPTRQGGILRRDDLTLGGTVSSPRFTTSQMPDFGTVESDDARNAGPDNPASQVPQRQESGESDGVDRPARDIVGTHSKQGNDQLSQPEPELLPQAIKVVVLSNGNYSVTADAISVVITSDMWLPPMVKWYLASVSEGRYRTGALPPKYEAMIWDFMEYLDKHKKSHKEAMNELELRLAWQWAEWRKQVLKEHGSRDVLPWTYFHGLSKALTAFYSKGDAGRVSPSSALTALKYNAENLSIIPVKLPKENLPSTP